MVFPALRKEGKDFLPFEEWFSYYKHRYEEVIEAYLIDAFSSRRTNYESFCLAVENIADSVDSFSTNEPFEINYDLDSMPTAYISWFLTRRIGDLVPFFVEEARKAKQFTVYDVGCGIGSVYFAIRIALDYLDDTDISVSYRCCDASQAMLNEFGLLRDRFSHDQIQYLSEDICSFEDWNPEVAGGHRLVCSSYLFGINDDNEEYRTNYLNLLSRTQADEVIITTSRRKYWHMFRLRGLLWRSKFSSSNWDRRNSEELDLPRDTLLTHFRRGMYIGSGQANARRRALLSGMVPWKSEGGFMTNFLHMSRESN